MPSTTKSTPWPATDRLPTPAELVDTAFDFYGQLLQVQRGFFLKAIEVTAPLYDRFEEQATKATSGKR